MSVSADAKLLSAMGFSRGDFLLNTWIRAAVITGLSVAALAAIGSGTWWLHKSRTVQLFGNLIPRVEVPDRLVALTFDDGPYPGYVDEVVAILGRHDVRGTFFLVGSAVEQYPDEARRLVDAGHEIGNHSYSHEPMVFKSLEFVRREIERTDEVIRSLGYEGRIHFRAPYGKRLIGVPYVLWRTGRSHVMWDVEPESYGDIARNAERIVSHVVENVRPGSIVLLHPFGPGRSASVEAVPRIIEELEREGFRFVTVSELIDRAAVPTGEARGG